VENTLSDERRKWGINENHYKSQIEEGKQSMNTLIRELQEVKVTYDRQNDSKKEESVKLVHDLRQKINELERLSQSREKQVRNETIVENFFNFFKFLMKTYFLHSSRMSSSFMKRMRPF
jgi:hypothetical protein